MPNKRYRPEDIIAKLREADILVSQGKTVAETIKVLGVRNNHRVWFKLERLYCQKKPIGTFRDGSSGQPFR